MFHLTMQPHCCWRPCGSLRLSFCYNPSRVNGPTRSHRDQCLPHLGTESLATAPGNTGFFPGSQTPDTALRVEMAFGRVSNGPRPPLTLAGGHCFARASHTALSMASSPLCVGETFRGHLRHDFLLRSPGDPNCWGQFRPWDRGRPALGTG